MDALTAAAGAADTTCPKAQGRKLNPQRKAALQLRHQIRGFGHVKGPGRDEQDMIRANT